MLDRMTAGVGSRQAPHRAARRSRAAAPRGVPDARRASTGPYTILYHRERPHTQQLVDGRARLGGAGDADRRGRAPLAAPPLPLAGARRRAAARPSTRACRCSSTTTSSSASLHPDAPDPGLLLERRRRRSLLRPRGRRHAALAARRRRASTRTTTSSCRGARCIASSPTRRPQHWLSIECTAGFGLLPQWRNDVGQLRMDAPYSAPRLPPPELHAARATRALRDLVVKRGGAFHGFRCDALAARRRRLGRHGLSVGVPHPATSSRASASCTCRRRGTARSPRAARSSAASCRARSTFTPTPSPAPTRTRRSTATSSSSTAAATSRRARGVGPGSISHHPAGILHGPHPGAYEGSIGARATDELAVMLDTYAPLHATAAALAIEDAGYHASFG